MTTIMFLAPGLRLAVAADGKFAVIVRATGAPDATRVGQSFAANAAADRTLYTDAGYEVLDVRLDQRPDGVSAADYLGQRLAAIRGAKDVQITLIGHGDVAAASPYLDPARFPPTRLTAGEGFRAPQDPSSDAPYQFLMPVGQDSLGTGDLRASLERLRGKNPRASTTLKVMNCYGGAVPRDLADVPKTQAFASTSRDAPAHVLADGASPRDFVSYFTEALGQGKTYHEAFLAAQDRFLRTSFLISASNPMEGGFSAQSDARDHRGLVRA